MIWIGMGGIAGALLRYFVGKWLSGRSRRIFPWGTWAINLLGSLLLGLVSGFDAKQTLPEWLWMFSGPGFCGAFTTFSTFTQECDQLFSERHGFEAGLYVLTTLGIGLLAAAAGMGLGAVIL